MTPTPQDSTALKGSPARGRTSRRRAARRSWWTHLFYGAFFCIGLWFLGVAAFTAVDTWSFLQRAKPTVGTVTGAVAHTDSKSRTTFTAKITYRDLTGEPHDIESRRSTKSVAYGNGQHVAVLHDPQAPGDGRVDTFGELWFGSLFSLGFGIAFTAMSAWQWRRAKTTPRLPG